MRSKTWLGLFAAVGVWITASLGVPCVNLLMEFTAEELMIVRGGSSAILFLILLGGTITRPKRDMLLFSILFSLSTFCFYKSIRSWGTNPTMILITTIPIVNFLFAWKYRNGVPRIAIISLGVILAGVTLALKPWDETSFSLNGLSWGILAAILAAVGYERLTHVVGSKLERCFWFGITMTVVGIIGHMSTGARLFSGKYPENTFWLLLGFALASGFFYFLANIEMFEHLRVDIASVLAQGETPFVILMSGILLGEELSPLQWSGVILALSGTILLGHWTAKNQAVKSTTP